MSFEAVRGRVLRHVLPDASGNMLVSVRLSDLRWLLETLEETADERQAARILVAEREIARKKVRAALRYLQLVFSDEDIDRGGRGGGRPMTLPPRAMAVARQVSEETGVPVKELLGRSVRVAVARSRQALYAALLAMPYGVNGHPSVCLIADWVGRDHSTVWYGIRRHWSRVEGRE